jgi:hypothetical protein
VWCHAEALGCVRYCRGRNINSIIKKIHQYSNCTLVCYSYSKQRADVCVYKCGKKEAQPHRSYSNQVISTNKISTLVIN